ncbi:MAG: D-alanine--D-alanine ligase [Desulfobacteraceae bacterium]|nr:D-alanine--D-alanine ligase [Desulfobacteraceae bacterium]
MGKIKLALLSGGRSSEREVSINSGNQVNDALDKDKYQVTRYDPAMDLPRLMATAADIDAALIILHGPNGEDGTVQGLLELLNIPYQGAGVLGSALAMNKLVSKQIYEKAGLPIPAYVAISRNDRVPADELVKRVNLPLVVKPVKSGSSIGMSIVRDESAVSDALDQAFLHDDTVLVEQYIEGIEITGGVIGNDTLEALPLIEIIPSPDHDFFDYNAKYVAGLTEEICPARIDERLTEKAKTFAVTAHQALFLQGYSRTDMIVAKTGIYVLETNTIPGMTRTSLFPQAAKAAGMSFGQLLDRLIELGMEAHAKKTIL